MIKKEENTAIEELNDLRWGHGYIVEEGEVQRFEGRILTLIEAAGMPEKQERALKGLVRQEIWETVSVRGALITSDQHTKIREENKGMGQSHPRPI